MTDTEQKPSIASIVAKYLKKYGRGGTLVYEARHDVEAMVSRHGLPAVEIALHEVALEHATIRQTPAKKAGPIERDMLVMGCTNAADAKDAATAILTRHGEGQYHLSGLKPGVAYYLADATANQFFQGVKKLAEDSGFNLCSFSIKEAVWPEDGNPRGPKFRDVELTGNKIEKIKQLEGAVQTWQNLHTESEKQLDKALEEAAEIKFELSETILKLAAANELANEQKKVINQHVSHIGYLNETLTNTQGKYNGVATILKDLASKSTVVNNVAGKSNG